MKGEVAKGLLEVGQNKPILLKHAEKKNNEN